MEDRKLILADRAGKKADRTIKLADTPNSGRKAYPGTL
jgi:hypothetical protein